MNDIPVALATPGNDATASVSGRPVCCCTAPSTLPPTKAVNAAGADAVRRAPAVNVRTAPVTAATMTATTMVDNQRWRSVPRTRYATALIYSVASATAGQVRAAVRAGQNAIRFTTKDCARDQEREREQRNGCSRGDADVLRDASPHDAADEYADRDADDEPHDGERRRLPRQRRSVLGDAESRAS